jgi:mRNA-degrading endonuclease RelE of RelBE toxin-antitoxin system
MTWRLEWRERALQDVERLDRRTRERIITSLERLAVSNYGDVVPLRGRAREWRLRVGRWRVLFTAP